VALSAKNTADFIPHGVGMFAAIFDRIGSFWTSKSALPLGLRGENAAAKYLRRKGYKIVARQDRAKLGEIDLVAVDGETIVFVEVKTRTNWETGHPLEAITPDKERRLTGAALAFLRANDLLEYAARFDVVAVTWPAGTQKPKIEHFENAFEPVGRWQMFS
jgi:putative endonuclease